MRRLRPTTRHRIGMVVRRIARCVARADRIGERSYRRVQPMLTCARMVAAELGVSMVTVDDYAMAGLCEG